MNPIVHHAVSRSGRVARALVLAGIGTASSAVVSPAVAEFVYLPQKPPSAEKPQSAPTTAGRTDVETLAQALAAALAAREADTPLETSQAPTEAMVDGPRPGCGYSTAGKIAHEDAYWLLCGEPLLEALGRWGARHGVLVVWGGEAGGEDDRWRVRTDYRFRASSFADVLAEIEAMPWRPGRPRLHFDNANSVLTVLEGDRHGPR